MNKLIKNILILLSYFCYSVLFTMIAYAFNINYYAMGIKGKLIFTAISSLIYLLFIIFIYRKELLIELKIFKQNYIRFILNNLLFYLLGLLLMAVSNVILTKITNYNLAGNEVEIRNYISKYPIYMVFSSIIFAPLIEELIFRKTIKNIFRYKYLFIILSGLIFGILHISNFRDINEILFSIPYIIMGMDFAFIYYKTNNIFTTITFHLCHNLILFIIQLL